jgi:hypothetical protein
MATIRRLVELRDEEKRRFLLAVPSWPTEDRVTNTAWCAPIVRAAANEGATSPNPPAPQGSSEEGVVRRAEIRQRALQLFQFVLGSLHHEVDDVRVLAQEGEKGEGRRGGRQNDMSKTSRSLLRPPCVLAPHLQRLFQHAADVFEVPQHGVRGDVPLSAYDEAVLRRSDLRVGEDGRSDEGDSMSDDGCIEAAGEKEVGEIAEIETLHRNATTSRLTNP